MRYTAPSLLHYRFAQAVSWAVSKVLFRNRVLRNEIKGQKGPFVVIANHQTMLDFVNLICTAPRPMSFVISRSFYISLPIRHYLDKMGVIPKQQFQTTVTDMKRMRSVIDHGAPLVIYPAGLMCEDGLSTPIPKATFKFLKWLGVDVYVARSRGSYFVMPKWGKGMRPGKTTTDIYRLFSAQELKALSIDELTQRTNDALLFDAYREQEELKARYGVSQDLRGLENVLYQCPNCGKEFTLSVQDKTRLVCADCGYELISDEFGFLHNKKQLGPALRYVSDWSRRIFENLKQAVERDPAYSLSCPVEIRLINSENNKFYAAGQAQLTLSRQGFHLAGSLNDQPMDTVFPIAGIPTLPFSPGKHFEIQQGQEIYRCVPENGRLVMKFINLVKIFYQFSLSESLSVS